MIAQVKTFRAHKLIQIAVLCFLALASDSTALAAEAPRLLVFTKTAGFRHESIPDGIALLEMLASQHGLAVDATEDAERFTLANLGRYRAIVWLNTTEDVLNDEQQVAFEEFVRSGGGYVGVHSATDTEYDWPWYGELLGGGGWFRSHPAIQTATLQVADAAHISTAHLPGSFAFTDEWYNFRNNPRSAASVLLTIDEQSYDPGPDRMGDHPLSWYHEIEGGRAWYTALGHRRETYVNSLFQQHLLGGILWAARCEPDCSASTAPAPTVPVAQCVGDCDANGEVSVAELVIAVNIALGQAPLSRCPATDVDRSGAVSIEEIVQAVNRVFAGC